METISDQDERFNQGSDERLKSGFSLMIYVNILLTFFISLVSVAFVYYVANNKPKILIYEFNGIGANFNRVYESGENIESNKIFLSQVLRTIVVDRETVDHNKEMVNQRLRRIRSFSTQKVYADYLKLIKNEDYIFNNVSVKRTITTDEAIQIGKSTYQIEFFTNDTYTDGEQEIRFWIATINYIIGEPDELAENNKYDSLLIQNPFGIKVNSYTISESCDFQLGFSQLQSFCGHKMPILRARARGL